MDIKELKKKRDKLENDKIVMESVLDTYSHPSEDLEIMIAKTRGRITAIDNLIKMHQDLAIKNHPKGKTSNEILREMRYGK